MFLVTQRSVVIVLYLENNQAISFHKYRSAFPSMMILLVMILFQVRLGLVLSQNLVSGRDLAFVSPRDLSFVHASSFLL